MSKTEIALLAVYRTPAVRLEDICDKYLNLDIRRANEMASLNMLDIPTFRIGQSRKAPRMVLIEDLARVIDEKAAAAKAAWETSQV